ncbi:MAG: PEP-CTERM sorting domain-containing protein [Planctomycetia bacterium]|nr:PEP-CTERM sorting domain-containing protein [Planctomycetia bacterium]
MRMQVLALAAIAACGILLHEQALLADQLGSASFNHLYNGDTYPVPDYVENVSADPEYAPSTDGSNLVYKNSIAESGAWWQNDSWTLGPDPVDNTVGWTIEFRIKIGTDAADDPTFGTFQVFAKDVNGNNSQGRRAVVGVGSGFTTVRGGGTHVDLSSNTDGFHTFRYAQPASSNTITLWRDDVLLWSGTSSTSNDSSGLVAQMWWGDGSSGLGGPTVTLDYFRWDSTGYHEPAGYKEGDLNGDHLVNLADFNIFKSEYRTSTLGRSDLDDNGVVNLADFVRFKNDYIANNPGQGADLVLPVPEPATIALVVGGLPALLLVRRRRARQSMNS